MDELFSCRNCVHNCGQSLLIGRGPGFCVKHNSVLWSPWKSTCKYLHRKDLPHFVVDEGIREHAAEFAGFSGIVDLIKREPIERIHYSEKFVWERKQFDPINQILAQYYKTKPVWIFLQAMSGGIDGRRMLTHAALLRRYMDTCGTWRSVYRFVLALVQELPNTPEFSADDLQVSDGEDVTLVRLDAVWDVFFARLSGIQEYGFHSGLEDLMWVTDHLNGALVSMDWEKVKKEVSKKTPEWIELISKHAKDEGAFFPEQTEDGWEDGEPI